MLETSILQQVTEIFRNLEADYTFRISYAPLREESSQLIEFLNDFASTSPHLQVEKHEAEGDTLAFSLLKNGEETGITFRGIPNGHEFTSLLLAVLNADGKGKNLPDEGVARRIRALKGNICLQTYVSLTCTNCPDVVQTLNIFALLNPNIRHEMVDGALFQSEVDKLGVQAVPAVFAEGKMLHVGRGSLGELLEKLEAAYPSSGETENDETTPVHRAFDVLVLGGGPAGASAAIYSARKGLKVAMVAERIGGQVKETVGIENLISVPYTTGNQLADNLRTHLTHYPIELFENRRIESTDLQGKEKQVTVKGGEVFSAPAVIIATGAGWRRLNVPGEAEYIGRGVAFCPHCDGPFYAGKEVAVVGGGNSGIEAAIDLAGICKKVTVVEFMDSLKADQVLQDKARSLPNVDILTSTQTTQVLGNGEKVTALRLKNRSTNEEHELPLDGMFVQIGLSANSAPFKEELETTRIGEIVIDAHCRTNVPGVYAAGDVSSVPYKQIIIAMGEGAKAALSAFDDRVRGAI
ncbi:MAG: alkyl hydroperoxide reductase subunit F [Bacteroides sp.]|nr:alkyl hydroperoxide reductase subunit F [Bacteroides sp.]MBQ8443684.1 alkyl hydroperoxide reductase subunit F [Bacteroides sp.]